MTIATVTLRNGAVEAEPMVRVTMIALRSLIQDKPIAFYELVMLCRDPAHRLFGNTREQLQPSGLLEGDGRVHTTVRNIVLAATEGDELEMRLVWPVADSAA